MIENIKICFNLFISLVIGHFVLLFGRLVLGKEKTVFYSFIALNKATCSL